MRFLPGWHARRGVNRRVDTVHMIHRDPQLVVVLTPVVHGVARYVGWEHEQRTRCTIRLVDPVRQWKFSPMDMESVTNWHDYTAAKEEMFNATDTDVAPWIVVRSNDKKRARINAMRYVLAQSDYDDKDYEVGGEPDPLIVGRALTD
jgi:Polyphosphate kinase 2 (PPK2)